MENQSEKLAMFVNFLNTMQKKRLIIFFATCASVDFHYFVLRHLMKDSITMKLHGKINQRKRTKIYN